MTTERKSIKVKIFGSEYPLRGESEEFTRQVAAHVDEMISAVHGKIPDQPPLTVAVLSALNITEDLLKERERGRKSAHDLEGEIGKMAAYMENCMREG